MSNIAKVSDSIEDSGETLERGELDDMIGIALIRAYNSAYKLFYKSIDKEMKPGYYTSLSLILKNPGLTQKALAHAIQRDPSTVVPILDAFEKKNWIVRQRSKTDRRAHSLFLTTAGKTAARRFDKKVADVEARIEAHLGKNNSRKLISLLNKLESLFE